MTETPRPDSKATLQIIPRPSHLELGDGVGLDLSEPVRIVSIDDAADDIAQRLAADILRVTGQVAPVTSHDSGAPGAIIVSQAGRGAQTHDRADAVRRADEGSEHEASPEAYELTVADGRVVITAADRRGLRYGAVTFGQIIRSVIGSNRMDIPAVRIADVPRYRWRGLSLDLARSFFPVEEVCRVIDLLVAYKLNVLHLHLTDDHGWRIQIDSWPLLTEVSGATAADGGGRAGFLSKADYAAIVEYATERDVLVVPEIDIPGHTNSVHYAYPALHPDGTQVAPYGGMDVGFSTISLSVPGTEQFLADVFRELAELTPGPYLHIGGDEAHSTPPAEYVAVIEEAQRIVTALGKSAIGWNETVTARLDPSTLAQFWDTNADPARFIAAAEAGTDVILSPANHAYLDMKYDETTPIGQDWAALIEVRDAYEWEPEELFPGMPPERIRGIEAGMWTETIHSFDGLGAMLLPRLPAIAEVAWSDERRDWDRIAAALVAHAPWWSEAGWTFTKSPQLAWGD